MATPNIVPRADSEGGLGTAGKRWQNGYFRNLHSDTIINNIAASHATLDHSLRASADGASFDGPTEPVAREVARLKSLGLYDEASLILVPAAGKSGRLYSVKGPDLTFMRASAGTIRDRNGQLVTRATDVPRIDGRGAGVLLEEQRTNLLLWSDQPDPSKAGWLPAAGGGTITPSFEVMQGIHAAKCGRVGSPAIGFLCGAQYNLSGPTAGLTFTAKVVLRNLGASARFNLRIREAGGLEPISHVDTFATVGHEPVTITTTKVLDQNDRARLEVWVTSESAGDYEIITNQWQLEAGSTAASYIKTEGAPVTRAADNLSLSGSDFAGIFPTGAFTVVTDFDAINGVFCPVLWVQPMGAYSFVDGILIDRQPTGLSQVRVRVSDATAATLNLGIRAAGRQRIAVTYDPVAGWAASWNGEAAVTDAATAVPSNMGRMVLGSRNGTTEYLNNCMRGASVLRRSVSPAALQALSAL